MNPAQLWETTMNPEKRILLQVKTDDKVAADEMTELKDITLNKKFIIGKGNEKQIDNFQKIYKEELINKNKINKKIKAIVACGNGTAGIFAPDILRGIGCRILRSSRNQDIYLLEL